MSLEELTADASVIVLGTVETAESRYSDDHRIIVTEVALRVERPIKGGPRDRVTLEALGGTVDGLTMIASGAPVFRPGDRAILFLHSAAEGRPLTVVGWHQGRIPVVHDPRTGRELALIQVRPPAPLDAQGRPLDTGRVGVGPVDLDQLLRQIELLAAPGHAGAPR